MNYTVCVDIKCNLDLRYAAGSGHNAVEMEYAEGLIILSKFSFTLKYVNLNRGLIVGSSRENLTLLCGYCGISLDNLGGNAAHSLDTE